MPVEVDFLDHGDSTAYDDRLVGLLDPCLLEIVALGCAGPRRVPRSRSPVDMFILGGENAYPAEVEHVLADNPAIADVAVVGVPDERWGEARLAVAVLQHGATLTVDDLALFCACRLARYKIPKRFEVTDELPRNAAGKVLKGELRERSES